MTTKFTAAALAGALAIVVSAAAATVAFDFAATPAFAQDKGGPLTEEQVRGLLSIGRFERQPAEVFELW